MTKCRDIMTKDPVVCTPNDTVDRVAQVMKWEDVGPVPIVDDAVTRRLLGIVTDRDLALKIVAEGREPKRTRVEEVMTLNPVNCRPDDDIEEALEAMEKHQLRRLPIVDEENCLVGIIAQADVARKLDSNDTADLVQEVSEPARP
ncbi:MAG TPA: CBS domain-containing protein [Thermoanaerobaculia bacterium]